MVSRLEGWESRLAAVIETARHRPYVLGEHDCFRVACAAVEALTGVDHWPTFAGRYATKREALALLAQHGSTFEAAGDGFFGVPHAPVEYAMRGDIVALRTADGEKHLAVWTGSALACMAEEGLLFLPRAAGYCCWKVG